MQKLITITIDVKSLQQEADGPFTVTEVDGINDLLEEGWAIEDYEFLSGDEESDKAVLLVILNDELRDLDEESDYNFRNEQEGEDDEEGEAFDEDEDEGGEDEAADDEEDEKEGETSGTQTIMASRA